MDSDPQKQNKCFTILLVSKNYQYKGALDENLETPEGLPMEVKTKKLSVVNDSVEKYAPNSPFYGNGNS